MISIRNKVFFLIEQKLIIASDLIVFIAMVSEADLENTIQCRQEVIIKKTGLSWNTISRSKSKLLEIGFLKKLSKKRFNEPDIFKINTDLIQNTSLNKESIKKHE